MPNDFDNEILQDFLVEAGELIEELGQQLVDLENTPEDYDLLNAIFRSFHTIKGGAGFLNITPMVSICHKAEDVFNTLRQGERKVNPALMDVVLQVVDVVTEMFERIREGNELDDPDPLLLNALSTFVGPETSEVEVVEQAADSEPPEQGEIDSSHGDAILETESNDEASEIEKGAVQGSDSQEISEEEFDDLLRALHDKQSQPAPDQSKSPPLAPNSEFGLDDLIGEQEFENLLDEIHGVGKHGSMPISSAAQHKQANVLSSTESEDKNSPTPKASKKQNSQKNDEAIVSPNQGAPSQGVAKSADSVAKSKVGNEESQSKSDLISETEFEDLLDQIHGKINHSAPIVDVKPKEAPPKPVEAQPAVIEVESKASTPEAPSKSPALKSPSAGNFISNPAIPENKPLKSSQVPGESTVRVDVQTLDDIMNLVGELVLVRNRFENLRTTFDREQIAKTISNLDVVTSDLRREVMKTRMQPIKKVFGRFPRVVRDLARNLKKEIRLDLRGEDTDLDKNLVEALADPLVHLVRNAVDHGIELPFEREAVGKPREGTVVLTASQEGDHIQLMIEDDGKGMNADSLRRSVVSKGLMDEETAARLENRECFNLIFMPGFSTKAEISDISGRGVGMDVVKTKITQMSGSVEVDSVEGKGTKIIIKVPLTLAIMPTLMVKLNDRPFALPLSSVVEILDLDLSRTHVVEGRLVVVVRGHALPLYYLQDWLVNKRRSTNEKSTGHVVVVNVGGRRAGFVVDHLIGQEEVVIKALGAKLHGVQGLSGATITGDGNIALIIDVPSLMSKYAA